MINASVLGVIQTALNADAITQVLGAENGITGVLNDRLFDLGLEDPAELERLRYTPSSALGSCRQKLADPDQDESEYIRILEVFRKHNVRYFFYNGGNDSMDTCNKVSKYMKRVGYPCRIIGVPKTIDNDLVGTDHCPGYGSAAKFIATVCAELLPGHAGLSASHRQYCGDYGPVMRAGWQVLPRWLGLWARGRIWSIFLNGISAWRRFWRMCTIPFRIAAIVLLRSLMESITLMAPILTR